MNHSKHVNEKVIDCDFLMLYKGPQPPSCGNQLSRTVFDRLARAFRTKA